ncbi:VOC family protein [Flavimaricola marinus]|uniref:Glyoxalase-like domain protein n=1 Tax=Flavimaricola marinus TaxID=1819565 RepID=A0A238LDJ5_9RHOB|nr:VOC family protein [Flavimaricola marinus]SMY07623.1 Glyoxalase-like domain protein [Flavimaricola marinus]
MARLEHVNVTVKDPDATAAMLGRLFGWKVRWAGGSIHGGRTVHVGEEHSYLAVYTGPPDTAQTEPDNSYTARGGLNHIGVVVDDLDEAEARVTAEGYKAHSHADYEPGKRFYFHEENGVEIEVICYA